MIHSLTRLLLLSLLNFAGHSVIASQTVRSLETFSLGRPEYFSHHTIKIAFQQLSSHIGNQYICSSIPQRY